jgi:hypothetical protein
MKSIVKTISLLCVAGFAIAAFAKRDAVFGAVDYLFFDGPYLSRTISYSASVIEPKSDQFEKIVNDEKFDDPLWYRIDLVGAINAINGNPAIDPRVKRRFEQFAKEYQAIKTTYQEKREISAFETVRILVGLVNKSYAFHKSRNEKDNLRRLLDWPYHAENHLINLASTTTACGTIAEATIALLRDMGFRTGMLGISETTQSIVFNHVFLEYYSKTHGKWVMLDPMINTIAGTSDRLLSTIEMLQSDQARRTLNDRWRKNGEYASKDNPDRDVYRSDYVVFFSRDRGPFKKVCYFADDAGVRKTVKERVLTGSFRPDWL